MAGLGKNLHLRTFDSTVKEFGKLCRSELVILSTQDERRNGDFLYLIHEVEPIAGHEVAVENFRPRTEHFSDALFDHRRRNLPGVGKLIYLRNGPLKIILDPGQDHGKNLQPCAGSHQHDPFHHLRMRQGQRLDNRSAHGVADEKGFS